MNYVPGVDMSTGSLGQGISAACGMALAAKLDNRDFRVYTILGDGEIEEGQVWEAAMFASAKKLDNLVVIVDNNNLQIDGCIEVKIQAYYGVKNKKLWGNPKDTRPDVDNGIKSLLDALNGLAWEDDGQVVKITAEKYYSSFDYCKIFYKKV